MEVVLLQELNTRQFIGFSPGKGIRIFTRARPRVYGTKSDLQPWGIMSLSGCWESSPKSNVEIPAKCELQTKPISDVYLQQHGYELQQLLSRTRLMTFEEIMKQLSASGSSAFSNPSNLIVCIAGIIVDVSEVIQTENLAKNQTRKFRKLTLCDLSNTKAEFMLWNMDAEQEWSNQLKFSCFVGWNVKAANFRGRLSLQLQLLNYNNEDLDAGNSFSTFWVNPPEPVFPFLSELKEIALKSSQMDQKIKTNPQSFQNPPGRKTTLVGDSWMDPQIATEHGINASAGSLYRIQRWADHELLDMYDCISATNSKTGQSASSSSSSSKITEMRRENVFTTLVQIHPLEYESTFVVFKCPNSNCFGFKSKMQPFTSSSSSSSSSSLLHQHHSGKHGWKGAMSNGHSGNHQSLTTPNQMSYVCGRCATVQPGPFSRKYEAKVILSDATTSIQATVYDYAGQEWMGMTADNWFREYPNSESRTKFVMSRCVPVFLVQVKVVCIVKKMDRDERTVPHAQGGYEEEEDIIHQNVYYCVQHAKLWEELEPTIRKFWHNTLIESATVPRPTTKRTADGDLVHTVSDQIINPTNTHLHKISNEKLQLSDDSSMFD